MSDPAPSSGTQPSTRGTRPLAAFRRRLKLALFCLTPAVLLVAAAELALRLFTTEPPLVPFSPEVYEDRELFWRVRPNLDTTCTRGDKPLRTNRLGLRDEEIGPKSPGEVRILCLGESTTYGDYVNFDETYAQVAQRHLNSAVASDPSPTSPSALSTQHSALTLRYRVINAGAPSYSSFQSLVYLKKLGLALKPDVVVLYHEGNDYLPSGWGGGRPGGETDPQRYQRLQSRPWLWWLTRLRVVRWPACRLAPKHDSRLLDLAWLSFGNRLPSVATRLSADEQRQVLDDFHEVCRQAGVRLVLIHPTYRATRRHDCPLTEFAQRSGVPLLETLDLFAASDGTVRPSLFFDPAHPTPTGHRFIGQALAELLRKQPWFPR